MRRPSAAVTSSPPRPLGPGPAPGPASAIARACGVALLTLFGSPVLVEGQIPIEAPPGAAAEWQLAVGWDEVPLVSVRRLSAPRGEASRQTRITWSFATPLSLAFTGQHWSLGVGRDRVRRFANGWGVATASRVSLTESRSAVADATAFGAEFAALPGRYGARGFAALELRWRAAVFTHLAHRAPVRDLFTDRYSGETAGPPDGWLAGGGTRVQVGVAGGRRAGDRTAILGRVGFSMYPGRPTVLVNPMLGQLPFYLTLGVGRSW